MSTPISEIRDYVRSVLGDAHPTIKQYHGDAVDSAIRTAFGTLFARGKISGITLVDGVFEPTLDPISDDTKIAWGLIIFTAAKRFGLPNSGSYAYNTRAISERFGENSGAIFDILSELYDFETLGAAGE